MKKRKSGLKPAAILFIVIILLSNCKILFPGGSGSLLNGDIIKTDESGNIVSIGSSNKSNMFAEDDSYAQEGASAAEDAQRDVVEPDIFRIEGDYLYLANTHNGLMVIDIADSENPALLGKIRTEGTPYEMYLNDNEVIMLLSNAGSWDNSRIVSIDVSNPDDPVSGSYIDIDGYIVDNRLVGNILYVVTNEYNSREDTYTAGGDATVSSASSIYDTLVTAFDINSLSETGSLTFSGYSNAIHVTDEYLFTASSSGSYWNSGESLITCYDISDASGTMTEAGTYIVKGAVADRFKIDEYNGYLRVVSYDWSDRETFVYSIDWNNTIDPVCRHVPLSLGKGEALFGTRFGDDYGYVVTFIRVDPLYVLDFTNPDNPAVIGELGEIPGWSDHIEIIGDRLFTLGVDDVSGWKVKVSYFDVSDPTNPQLLDDLILGEEGGYSYSSASWDYKRINYQEYLEAWAIPFSWYDYDSYTYNNSVSLIKIEPSTIQEYVRLPHPGQVKRTMNVESNIVYTYSDEVLRSCTVGGQDSYTQNGDLIIAENVSGLFTLSDDTAVKKVSVGWGSETWLRSFSLSDYDSTGFTGQIVIGDENYWGWWYSDTDQFLSKGNYLYALQNLYTATELGCYIDTYDFTIPESPEFSGRVKISENTGGYGQYPQKQNQNSFTEVDENIFCVQTWNELNIVRLENGLTPELLSSIDFENIDSFFVADQICYVNSIEYPDSQETYYSNILTAWDLSNPGTPQQIFSVIVPGQVLYRETPNTFLSYYISYGELLDSWDWANPVYCLISFSIDENTIQTHGILELDNSISSYYSEEGIFAWFGGYGYYGLEYDYAVADMAWYPYNGGSGAGLFTARLGTGLQPEKTEVTIYNNSDSWYNSRIIPYNSGLVVTAADSVYVFNIENGGLSLESEVPRDVELEYGGVCRIIDRSLYEAEGYGGINRTDLF